MQGFAGICENQKQRHVVNMSALHRHLIHEFLEMHHAFKLNSSAEEIFHQTFALDHSICLAHPCRQQIHKIHQKYISS